MGLGGRGVWIRSHGESFHGPEAPTHTDRAGARLRPTPARSGRTEVALFSDGRYD